MREAANLCVQCIQCRLRCLVCTVHTTHPQDRVLVTILKVAQCSRTKGYCPKVGSFYTLRYRAFG